MRPQSYEPQSKTNFLEVDISNDPGPEMVCCVIESPSARPVSEKIVHHVTCSKVQEKAFDINNAFASKEQEKAFDIYHATTYKN